MWTMPFVVVSAEHNHLPQSGQYIFLIIHTSKARSSPVLFRPGDKAVKGDV